MSRTERTSEIVAAIRQMAATHNLREIGRELNVSRQTVLNWGRANGIKLASMSEAAKRRLPKMPMPRCGNRKHSLELCAEIAALKGVKSATQIAREYGLASKNVVIGIWDRAL